MSSAADINAGRAVIGVSLDDSKLQQQMEAVSAKMRAAAVGASASTLPSLTKETLKPSTEYESSLRTLESVYKTGAVSQDYFRQQLAELATQYTATASPAQKFGVELSKLDGDLKRGDLTTEQYAAKLEGLTADYWKTANATERFEGQLVALERDFTRGTLTQDQYKVALQNVHREFRSAATPVERYHDDLRVLDERLKAGTISQQAYSLAVEKVRADLYEVNPPAQRYAEAIRQLDAQLKSGAITQAQYAQAVGKAKLSLIDSHLAANKTNSAFAGLASQIGSYVAGFASLATVVGVIRSVGAEFEKVEQESLLAKKLGMAEDRFQGLKIAAQQADVEFALVETAMVKMSVAIGKASLKGEESTKWLDRMGVSVSDLVGLSADKQFLLIADAMRRNLNESEQLAAATEIFGRGTTDMIRLLGLTKEKLDETTEAAIRNGQALSGASVEAIKEANDALDNLSNSWEGLKRSMASGFGPALSEIFRNMADILRNIANFPQDFKDSLKPQAGSIAGNYYGVEADTPAADYDNAALERWRKENSKEAIAAREQGYATQFENEMQSRSNDMDRQKNLDEELARQKEERIAAEQAVVDQTNAYADQFSATMEAADRRNKEILDTREYERKAAEDLAKQEDEYAKMFEGEMETRSKEMGGKWEEERARLASRTSQGTFSGWRLGQMYNSEQIDREQLAELKKANENLRELRMNRGEKPGFYT